MSEQLSMFPELDWKYVEVSVERVKLAWLLNNQIEGKKMILAFSGGKDSICLFFVCKQASEELGVPMEDMFDVQYNITTVDPPELVQFVRQMKKDYPFIQMIHPKKTMWQMIVEKHLPPLRAMRYCCAELKETNAVKGGYTLTGVRRAESAKRAERGAFEKKGKNLAESVRTDEVFLSNDNTEDRRESEFCQRKATHFCNPIIDWSDEDVWHFIKGKNLPYCKLYDEGFTRLGCIGCPLSSDSARQREFARWPGYKKQYIRSFQKMLDWIKANEREREGLPPGYLHLTPFLDGQDVFDWWTHDPAFKERHQGEISEYEDTLFNLGDEE